MATTISDTNLASRRLDWVTDLALGSKTFANNEQRVSTNLKTVVPVNFLLLCQLTSGALNLAVSVHSGTPSFGAGLTISDTTYRAIGAQTTLVNTNISVQATAGVAGAVGSIASARLEGKFGIAGTAYTGYHEATAAFNGLDPVLGGVFADTLV